jgi:hypothetical protein
MDRTLVVEFPWFALASDMGDPTGAWSQSIPTDTRLIATNAYAQELKLDLSGYVQSDLTVGFRRSFEQVGGSDSMFWLTYDVNSDALIETTIISSVPFNDAQLVAAAASSPGFTPYESPLLDFGNFNRTHIIHGHHEVKYPNSTIGAGAFASSGNAVLMNACDNYFSSLEPTAADCLYCYRVFLVPPPANNRDGVNSLVLPAKRVILDAFTVEEPDLEYMMRLKRSYELANQV